MSFRSNLLLIVINFEGLNRRRLGILPDLQPIGTNDTNHHWFVSLILISREDQIPHFALRCRGSNNPSELIYIETRNSFNGEIIRNTGLRRPVFQDIDAKGEAWGFYIPQRINLVPRHQS